MKRKVWIIIAVIAIAVAVFVFPWWRESVEDKPTIKIGATLPLTGNIAFSGNSTKKALEMQLARETSKSLKYNYKFIFENNESSTAKTAATVRKLISVDKVRATISTWNMFGIVVANAANPAHVLNMHCSWEDEGLRGPYTYNMISTHDRMSGLLADELKKRGVRKVAIVADNSSDTIIDIMIKHLHSAGIKIVLREKTIEGQRDYMTEVAKGVKANPDMYITMGTPPLAYIFTKRLYEATGKKNVTTIDGFMESPDDQRPMFEGLWYVDSNANGGARFEEDLLREKHTEVQSCAGNSAANLQILIRAFENAPVREGNATPTNEDVNEYIRNNTKDIETVAAGRATLIRDGVIEVPPFVKIIKNGKPVFAKE